jgi:hypothetical protein
MSRRHVSFHSSAHFTFATFLLPSCSTLAHLYKHVIAPLTQLQIRNSHSQTHSFNTTKYQGHIHLQERNNAHTLQYHNRPLELQHACSRNSAQALQAPMPAVPKAAPGHADMAAYACQRWEAGMSYQVDALRAIEEIQAGLSFRGTTVAVRI